MRYVVELEDGERWDVEVDDRDPSRVKVGGSDREVVASALRDGSLAASANGRRQRMRVTFEDGTMVVETEDGRRRRATVQSAAAAAWGQGPGQKVVKVAPEGRDLVKAPIAGSVLRLSAEDGARVERGQPILVIEAMKMQNTITAPQDGVVRFEVKPGQSVPSGALLARVTSPEGTA